MRNKQDEFCHWAQLTAFREFPGRAPEEGSEVNSLDCENEAESWWRSKASRVHRTKIQLFLFAKQK